MRRLARAAPSPSRNSVSAGLRAATLDVDLGAVAANYRWFVAVAGRASCAACVKADAYGLGLTPVASTLWQAGCREFFVASVGEGAALRAVLPQAVIYVLNGYLPPELPTLRAAHLVPVLNDPSQVATFEAVGRVLGALTNQVAGFFAEQWR